MYFIMSAFNVKLPVADKLQNYQEKMYLAFQRSEVDNPDNNMIS